VVVVLEVVNSVVYGVTYCGRKLVLGADMAALLENVGWRVSVVVSVAWAPSVNSSKTTMAIAQAPCPTTYL